MFRSGSQQHVFRALLGLAYFLRGEPPPVGLAGTPNATASLADAVSADPPLAYFSFFADVRNAQARYLCGAAPACREPHGRAPEELLDAFAVVGVLEDLRGTLLALERALPRIFAGVAAAHRDGDRAFLQAGDAARPRDDPLPAAAADRLSALFAEDAALHRAATARLGEMLGDGD